MESWQSSPLFEGDRFLWRSNRGRESERRDSEIGHEAQKRGVGGEDQGGAWRLEIGLLRWLGKELAFWVGWTMKKTMIRTKIRIGRCAFYRCVDRCLSFVSTPSLRSWPGRKWNLA